MSQATMTSMAQWSYRLAAKTREIDDLFGIMHRTDVPTLTIEEINEGIAEGAAESGTRGVED